jgi:hypothetical protein
MGINWGDAPTWGAVIVGSVAATVAGPEPARAAAVWCGRDDLRDRCGVSEHEDRNNCYHLSWATLS